MMDYKKIITSRKLRIKIMQILSFLPDKAVVSFQYKIKTGRKLNLVNPLRYTEKLQWYKLYYRDPVMGKCADKYAVREYVKKMGYEEILVPIVGIYKSANEINFDVLPSSFVIKDTLGGGGNSVIIIKNKEEVDIDSLKSELKGWIGGKRGKHPGREWVYDGKKSRILIESYIESDVKEGGLIDYKFFCFNGEVAYVYAIADRIMGKGAGLGIYDGEFNLLPYSRMDEKNLTRIIKKPNNYDEMIKCARVLSKRFPHARIDLYNQNGRIRFGEITFFDGSGYMTFRPDEFDFLMGEKFKLTFYSK